MNRIIRDWVLVIALILLFVINAIGHEEGDASIMFEIKMLKQRTKHLEDAQRQQHDSFVKHLGEHIPKWRFDQVDAAQQKLLDEVAFQRGYESEATKRKVGIIVGLLAFLGIGFALGYTLGSTRLEVK